MKYLIGLGNDSMGDDGIGLHLIDYLVEHRLARDFRTVRLADDGTRLLNFFHSETEAIVLVDCVRSGREPGESVLFSPDEVESEKLLAGMSTHEGDILKVIRLAGALGYPIPPLRILGIQPESIELRMGISALLERKLPEYADTLFQALAG